jgi:predicted PurR-regulated permease PerM
MDKELKLILPKRTSILHYVFCYFIAQCLIEIKKDLFDEIIYTAIKKWFKLSDENTNKILFSIINIIINIVIIICVVFFVFLRKKIRIKRIKSIHSKKQQNPIKKKLQKKSKK